jgi:hypothetical protein
MTRDSRLYYNARGGTRTRMALQPRDFKFVGLAEPRDTKSITARQGNGLARRAVLIDTGLCPVVRGTAGGQRTVELMHASSATAGTHWSGASTGTLATFGTVRRWWSIGSKRRLLLCVTTAGA